MRWSNEPTASCGSMGFARRIRRRRARECRRDRSTGCIHQRSSVFPLTFLCGGAYARAPAGKALQSRSGNRRAPDLETARESDVNQVRNAVRVRQCLGSLRLHSRRLTSRLRSSREPRRRVLAQTSRRAARRRAARGAAYGRRYDLSTSSGADPLKGVILCSLRARLSVLVKNRQLDFARPSSLLSSRHHLVSAASSLTGAASDGSQPSLAVKWTARKFRTSLEQQSAADVARGSLGERGRARGRVVVGVGRSSWWRRLVWWRRKIVLEFGYRE
jgi:hypothetical protein